MFATPLESGAKSGWWSWLCCLRGARPARPGAALLLTLLLALLLATLLPFTHGSCCLCSLNLCPSAVGMLLLLLRYPGVESGVVPSTHLLPTGVSAWLLLLHVRAAVAALCPPVDSVACESQLRLTPDRVTVPRAHPARREKEATSCSLGDQRRHPDLPLTPGVSQTPYLLMKFYVFAKPPFSKPN